MNKSVCITALGKRGFRRGCCRPLVCALMRSRSCAVNLYIVQHFRHGLQAETMGRTQVLYLEQVVPKLVLGG